MGSEYFLNALYTGYTVKLSSHCSVFQSVGPDNLFVNYLSRIHREEVSSSFCLIS